MNLACRIDPRKASAGCRQISLAVALLLPPGSFMPMSIAADVQSAPVSAGSLMEAVTSGTLLLNVRPRFEQVQQDGKREDAEAFTNRLLAGWRTLPYHGFSVTAEMINVFRIGDQHYNDTPVASPRYPTVADPEMTDVNHLFEWDLGVTYPFLKQLLGKIEYADFREGDVLAPATARKRDTRKLWLTLIYNY